MKKQINIFFCSISFFTRCKIPFNIDFSEDNYRRASFYLPFVGILVGVLSAITFYALNLFLPITINIILTLTFSILFTGAIHEDGFADTCDGFGGGWNKEQILSIMKDSMIGTYGVVGLILLILLKITVLSELNPVKTPILLAIGHIISRVIAITFLYDLEYARANQTSKAKHVISKISKKDLSLIIFFGLLVLMLANNYIFFLYIPIAIVIRYFFSKLFKKNIGGYTGDCLGAVQQTSELALYLFALILELNNFNVTIIWF